MLSPVQRKLAGAAEGLFSASGTSAASTGETLKTIAEALTNTGMGGESGNRIAKMILEGGGKQPDPAKTQRAIDFLNTVIKPALAVVGKNDPDREALLLGTAIAESELASRTQIGGGPAKGFFQVEIFTHDDHYKHYLDKPRNAELKAKILSTLTSPDADRHLALENNDIYGALMAWIKYVRSDRALPSRHNLREMAQFWKNHYNTSAGKGTPEEFIERWKSFFGNATLP